MVQASRRLSVKRNHFRQRILKMLRTAMKTNSITDIEVSSGEVFI